MGYFAFNILSKLLSNEERQNLLHPWSKAEFLYASHILKGSSTDTILVAENAAPVNLDHQLTMGEFILMELYRLGQVDENTMIDLKELFQALDKNHNDLISYEEIMQLDYASGRARASTESRLSSKVKGKTSNAV